ncbi:hypothetical protein HYC85_007252 [Camellia sinensis]|uniref:Uncharacterized protein n=1 Tax=Camellia sinensis TaxID=4442 RepID=A0A7J7HQT0_CAMSI|nr:hypothetical protein HYC85_007252 [Camellia sinensis]
MFREPQSDLWSDHEAPDGHKGGNHGQFAICSTGKCSGNMTSLSPTVTSQSWPMLQWQKLKNEGDAKTPLTMTHLKVLFMDMVLGGTATTSNAIEFAMAEMMNKP